jgi:chondroitin sulfate synthase
VQNVKGSIFVGVMTAKKFLDTRATAVYKTWAATIPGKVEFFSSIKDKEAYIGLPIVSLPGVSDNMYPPQKKSFMMLKYMHDKYIDKYEWFVRSDDDVFIRGDRLANLLHSINSSKPYYIGQAGQGLKSEVGKLGLKNDENFCMGGTSMIFSRETLKRVVPNISYCLKHLYTKHEDVEIGRCVHIFANVQCTWAFEVSLKLCPRTTRPRTIRPLGQLVPLDNSSPDNSSPRTIGALAPCRWQHTENRFSLSYACVTF